MSKKNKNDKKRQQKERRRRETFVRPSSSNKSASKQLDQLLQDGKLVEAHDLLLSIAEQDPRNITVLFSLAEVSMSIDNAQTLFWAGDRLIALDSRDFYAYAHRFNAALKLGLPAVAISTAKKMQRIPHDPEHDAQINEFLQTIGAKKFVADIRQDAVENGDDFSPYDDNLILDAQADHERSLFYLRNGQFEMVVKICDSMIQSCPVLRSPYNNRAIAMLMFDGAEKASRALDENLARNPNNVFALSFKIQQLVKLGRRAETPPLLDRIKPLKAPSWKEDNSDFFLAKMDAFAWTEDDQSLLATYQEAKDNAGDKWQVKTDRACAHMTHFAAVAYARLGEKDKAEELWHQAASCPGAAQEITENRTDLKKPEWEKNGPWYFELNDWVPKRLIAECREIGIRHNISEDNDLTTQKRLMDRYILPLYKQMMTRWPYLRQLRFEMLRCGDELTRRWLLLTINDCRDPEFFNALFAFALGREGSDSFRMAILQKLGEVGHLNPGPVLTWNKGQQTQKYYFCFNIYWHSNMKGNRLSKRGIGTLSEAIALIGKGELERAIEILEKLNEKEPNDCSVLYNIAVCKEALGNREAYRVMINQILEMHPDYFFAKIGKARCLTIDKHFEEAYAILLQLLALPSLHGTEAIALVRALVLYHLVKEEEATARTLHSAGESMFPGQFPSLHQLRREAGLSINWSDALGYLGKRLGIPSFPKGDTER